MRYLVIAYDFPPIPSPQSLRWAYLVRELAFAGHEVHVLAPQTGGYGGGGLPELPASVVVHRVWPGPITALLVSRRADGKQVPHNQGDPAAGIGDDTAMVSGAVPSGLNWKGRLAERMKQVLSWFMFPDIRAEWMPAARRELERVLNEHPPDIVITSHEPANTIELGLFAKGKGFRWISDLGDPVLAPYTPRRWRARARALEARMCSRADAITVTSARACEQLLQRHGLGASKCSVLSQGFDHRFEAPAGTAVAGSPFRPDLVELLYTGSFYSFRRLGALLDAIVAVPGVRLNIASMAVPAHVAAAAEKHSTSIRLLGFIPHREALWLQRQCDVLVNIGNDDPVQIPGKLYEYLGACAPILNIDRAADTAVTALLGDTGAGRTIADKLEPIRSELKRLVLLKSSGHPISRAAAPKGDLMQYSWFQLSCQLQNLAESIVAGRDHSVA